MNLQAVRFTNISLNKISARFHKRDENILEKISFSINQGEVTAILGPAGSGKTTLLNVLLGTQKFHEGSIQVNGLESNFEKNRISHYIGYVPQDDLTIDVLTVFENLFFRYKILSTAKLTNEIIHTRIDDLLIEIGLIHKKGSRVGNVTDRILSGGERKRLNIALELINEPDILILDEPTTGLSSQDAYEILELLRILADQGKIVLLFIHQPSSQIYKLIDKVVILANKHIAFSGNAMETLRIFREASREVPDYLDYLECPTCRNVNPDLLMQSIKDESINFWSALK